MRILALDPGNVESAYVLMDAATYIPLKFGKERNELVRERVRELSSERYPGGWDEVVIEMVASYGMPVGATVFETCVEIGRLIEVASPTTPTLVYRREVKRNICGVVSAKDSNIIQALIDRFAPYTPNRGKGYKKEPGFFYGFKADVWQAYALGVTYLDLTKEGKR